MAFLHSSHRKNQDLNPPPSFVLSKNISINKLKIIYKKINLRLPTVTSRIYLSQSFNRTVQFLRTRTWQNKYINIKAKNIKQRNILSFFYYQKTKNFHYQLLKFLRSYSHPLKAKIQQKSSYHCSFPSNVIHHHIMIISSPNVFLLVKVTALAIVYS